MEIGTMTLPKIQEDIDAAICKQEPPDDYRIFNRRQPDGTFKPMSEFFEPMRKIISVEAKQNAEILSGKSNYDLLEEAYGALSVLAARAENGLFNLKGLDKDESYILDQILDASGYFIGCDCPNNKA